MKENQPEEFNQIYKVILAKDYIRYRLTGNLGVEVTDTSSTLLLDIKRRCWSEESLDILGRHGRTASYPTAPAQIPAFGTTALGSSENLPFVKELIGFPKFSISLYMSCAKTLFCIGFRCRNDVAICINLYLRGCIIHFRKYGLPYGLSVFLCTLHLIVTNFDAPLGMGGWLDLTQQRLSPCKKYRAFLAFFR